LNNVAYALYFNFFFTIGWMLEMKYGHWIYGYGFISAGLMIMYFLEEIIGVVKWIRSLFKPDKTLKEN